MATATPQYAAPKWTLTGSANSAQLRRSGRQVEGEGGEEGAVGDVADWQCEPKKMLALIKCDQRAQTERERKKRESCRRQRQTETGLKALSFLANKLTHASQFVRLRERERKRRDVEGQREREVKREERGSRPADTALSVRNVCKSGSQLTAA